MTIAGSDSGGGAGVQADLRTFAALGVHGTSALTAVTAQNTVGVQGIHVVPPAFVREQIASVTSDLDVSAVKTGLLATAATIEVVAERARANELPNLVVDPVMVSSSGHRLLEPEAEKACSKLLIPNARIVTPNLEEAAILCGANLEDLDDLDDLHRAARHIHSLGSQYVLVKGGHLGSGASPDVLFDGDRATVLWSERVPTRNDHGTGCTLSAAIAANLAKGSDVVRAVTDAKAFVSAAILSSASWRLGGGHGPLDHLGAARALEARAGA